MSYHEGKCIFRCCCSFFFCLFVSFVCLYICSQFQNMTSNQSGELYQMVAWKCILMVRKFYLFSFLLLFLLSFSLFSVFATYIHFKAYKQIWYINTYKSTKHQHKHTFFVDKNETVTNCHTNTHTHSQFITYECMIWRMQTRQNSYFIRKFNMFVENDKRHQFFFNILGVNLLTKPSWKNFMITWPTMKLKCKQIIIFFFRPFFRNIENRRHLWKLCICESLLMMSFEIAQWNVIRYLENR